MQGSSKLSSNKIMYYKDDHEVAPAKQNVITAWLKAMLKFTFFEPWYENNLKLFAWATK